MMTAPTEDPTLREKARAEAHRLLDLLQQGEGPCGPAFVAHYPVCNRLTEALALHATERARLEAEVERLAKSEYGLGVIAAEQRAEVEQLTKERDEADAERRNWRMQFIEAAQAFKAENDKDRAALWRIRDIAGTAREWRTGRLAYPSEHDNCDHIGCIADRALAPAETRRGT